MGRGGIDLHGRTFGYGTIVSRKGANKYGQIVWKLKCKCGKRYETAATRLLQGLTKSCGCYQKQRQRDSLWKGYGDITGAYYCRLRRCALRRKIPFEISIEEMWDLFILQKGRCALTRLPIKISNNIKGLATGEQTASLDRIDSTIGYKAGNIQWLDKRVNQMKLNLPEQEFIKLCKRIAKNN